MLAERIIKLSSLASKDQTRSSLCGVWLAWENNTPILEVTDGHRAVREPLDQDSCPQFDGFFFIPLEKIPLLKAVVKNHGKMGFVPVSYDIEADLLSFGVESELVLKRTEKKPPPFKQIYTVYDLSSTQPVPEALLQPGAHMPVFQSISFNAKYLLEIAEALKTEKNPIVRLIFKDATSPITVLVGKKDAVLMPCRV